MQRDLDGISQKVLTDSLRQMAEDGLIYRRDYHELPPRVDYGLTELGTQMLPIIDALAAFGNYYKSVLLESRPDCNASQVPTPFNQTEKKRTP